MGAKVPSLILKVAAAGPISAPVLLSRANTGSLDKTGLSLERFPKSPWVEEDFLQSEESG